MISIGELRKRVAIQTYTETESGTYKTSKVWVTVVTVFGQLSPVSGLTAIDTMQIGQKVTHKVYIRFYPNVTSENWLLIEGRRFRIRTVINIEELNQFLELLVEEAFPSSHNFDTGTY